MSAASAAVDSFHLLQEVIVDGERDFRDSSFWESAGALLKQLLDKPLERLTLRSLPLSGSLVERRTQMQFLQDLLQKFPSCSSLHHVGFHNVLLAEEDRGWAWFTRAFQALS